jgi:hypothetical protein
MSRWTEQFDSHVFHRVWSQLKADLETATIDDETILTSVKELARLKKVISYIDEMLNSIDPELVPLTTWDTFNGQSTSCGAQVVNYNSNRNIAHIQAANSHADNLLTYIRPYMIVQGKAKTVLHNSFVEYTKTIEDYINSFQIKAASQLDNINNNDSESNNIKLKLEEVKSTVDVLKVKLFGDEDGSTVGIESKIDEAFESIETQHANIIGFHNELLVDAPKAASIKTSISEALERIDEEKSKILQSISEAENKLGELQGFYVKVFGKLNDEDERVGGLSNEIATRLAILRELEISNKDRYVALNEQIESLLPGATSAGLATAYKNMKDTFDSPIKSSERLFYFSVALLTVASLFSIIDRVWWFGFEVAKFSNWDGALKAVLTKSPLYGALIWLAFFASKRRSENQRLQQEYAHKEALASSYDNYKKQIIMLDSEDQLMQKEFINKAVDAISYNVSQTLDGKHGDSHPFQYAIKSVSDNVSKVTESISEIKGMIIKR